MSVVDQEQLQADRTDCTLHWERKVLMLVGIAAVRTGCASTLILTSAEPQRPEEFAPSFCGVVMMVQNNVI